MGSASFSHFASAVHRPSSPTRISTVERSEPANTFTSTGVAVTSSGATSSGK